MFLRSLRSIDARLSLAVLALCAVAATGCGGSNNKQSGTGGSGSGTGGSGGMGKGQDGAAGGVGGEGGGDNYDLALQFSAEVNGGTNPWSYGETASPGGTFTAFTIDSHADAGSAVSFFYHANAVDPNITASGGDLVGWNGSESNPAHPAGTAYYPIILKNVGTTPFVVSSNAGLTSDYSIQPGQVYAHPSPTNIVDARFTAPRNLTARTIHAQFDRLQNSTTTYAQTVLVVVNGSTLFSQVLSGNGASASFTSTLRDLRSGDTVDFMIQPMPRFDGGSMALTAQIGAASGSGGVAGGGGGGGTAPDGGP